MTPTTINSVVGSNLDDSITNLWGAMLSLIIYYHNKPWWGTNSKTNTSTINILFSVALRCAIVIKVVCTNWTCHVAPSVM